MTTKSPLLATSPRLPRCSTKKKRTPEAAIISQAPSPPPLTKPKQPRSSATGDLAAMAILNDGLTAPMAFGEAVAPSSSSLSTWPRSGYPRRCQPRGFPRPTNRRPSRRRCRRPPDPHRPRRRPTRAKGAVDVRLVQLAGRGRSSHPWPRFWMRPSIGSSPGDHTFRPARRGLDLIGNLSPPPIAPMFCFGSPRRRNFISR